MVLNAPLRRTDPFSTTPMPKTVATKPYDWTYTTTYSGHETQVSLEQASDISSSLSPNPPPPSDADKLSIIWKPADPEDPTNSIPLAELTRPDPILFYAEIPLFEDELHDNGASSLIVRIVCLSPHSWLSYRAKGSCFLSA